MLIAARNSRPTKAEVIEARKADGTFLEKRIHVATVKAVAGVTRAYRGADPKEAEIVHSRIVAANNTALLNAQLRNQRLAQRKQDEEERREKKEPLSNDDAR